MAVVGEIVGKVAHEVLNPVSAMLTSVEHKLETSHQSIDTVELIKEILLDWETHFNNGNLESYLQKTVEGQKEKTFGQEDFESMYALIRQFTEHIKENNKEWEFLHHHILRVVKIVDGLRVVARRKKTVEELDINQPLKEALELMKESLRKQQIELSQKQPVDLPKIKADFNEMLQVFCNLIRNSMQAITEKNEHKGGKIAIETMANKAKLLIKISDTGNGISKENMAKIFDANFTTKGRHEGTGLGLNISRRFIRECGGDIKVEKSSKEQGTTMAIWLPLKQGKHL